METDRSRNRCERFCISSCFAFKKKLPFGQRLSHFPRFLQHQRWNFKIVCDGLPNLLLACLYKLNFLLFSRENKDLKLQRKDGNTPPPKKKDLLFLLFICNCLFYIFLIQWAEKQQHCNCCSSPIHNLLLCTWTLCLFDRQSIILLSDRWLRALCLQEISGYGFLLAPGSLWYELWYGCVTVHKKEKSSKIQFYQGTRPGSEIKGLSKSLLKELYFFFLF